jgi:hypothetical protein
MIVDSLRRHLAQELPKPLRETVDLAIKDRVRLLRLPNTIHERSNLYKIALDVRELERLSTQEIREMARQTRPLALTDSTGMVSVSHVMINSAAAELFERIRRQSARMTRKPFAYRFERPADLTSLAFPCAGLHTIWQSHIEAGYRNNCAIRLASELRLLGLTAAETEAKLGEWNEGNAIELAETELRSVVHSAYQHRFPYRYSCRDPIRRRFCPLPDLQSCRRYVQEHTATQSQHGASPTS